MSPIKDCCGPKDKNRQFKTRQDSNVGPDLFLASIIILTLVALFVVIYFGSKIGTRAQVIPNRQAALSVATTRFDWGTVDYDGGIVSKTFTIKNTGREVLKLYAVKTSCACTTAQLKTANAISKNFGMHENSSAVFAVNPGQTAQLLVKFDPAYHGLGGLGAVSRTVTLQTNDPRHPELLFDLKASVVRKQR